MVNRPASFIVNADDFGKNETTNRAISEAFAKGVISSATILSNMPGFDDACEIIMRQGLRDRIGVHLNISEGRPLTEPVTSVPSLCDGDGNFLFREKSVSLVFPARTARAIYLEMRAQIKRVIDAGIRPTHLDSHRHVHTIWAVATQVIALAKEFNIDAVRLSANVRPSPDRWKRVYKYLFNRRLRYHNLARTRWFGSLPDMDSCFSGLSGPVEVMVHPAYDDRGRLINVFGKDSGFLLPEASALYIQDRMTSYGHECGYGI